MKKYLNKDLYQNILIIVLLLMTVIIFCKPLYNNHFFDNHEKLHYFLRVAEVHDAVTNGQYYARWFSNFNGGYGYPFLNYYAPLSFYLPELIYLLGFSILFSIKSYIFSITFVGCLGMYFFATCIFNKWISFVVSLAFLFAPYHILNIFVRGDFAEYTAISIIPWSLFFINRTFFNQKETDCFLGIISISFIILSHNITALFAYPILLLYAVFLFITNIDLEKHKIKKTIYLLYIIFKFSLLGTMFFWAPALSELKYVKSSMLINGDYVVKNHFVYLWQFFSPKWDFGMSVPSDNDGLSYQIGIFHWIYIFISIACCYAIFKLKLVSEYRNVIYHYIFFIAILFLMLFMMLPISKIVYDIIPLINFVQFPWRLLVFVIISSSLIVGCSLQILLQFLNKNNRIYQGILIAASIFLIFVFYMPYIKVSGFFPIVHEYKGENTRKYFLSTTIGEYLPISVVTFPEKLSNKNLIVTKGGPVLFYPEKAKSVEYVFSIRKISSKATIQFETFYFPNWSVYLDNKPIEVKPSSPHGLIEFNISDMGELKIIFKNTLIRNISCIVSIFSWIFSIMILIIIKYKFKKNEQI